MPRQFIGQEGFYPSGMMVQQSQNVVSCTACHWREEIK